MNYSNKEDRFQLLLAALLHDIGKFKYRAESERKTHQDYGEEFVREYLGSIDILKKNIEKVCSLINTHHSNSCAPTLRRADHLDASIREEDKETNARRPLRSIFPQIHLSNHENGDTNIYSLRPLKLDTINEKNIDLFIPERGWETTEKDEELIDLHNNMWKEFIKEVKNIPNDLGETSLVRTLYYLLWKYTFRVSSAGYHSKPNIPLFDHLRVTATLQDCFLCSDNDEDPFLVIEGDLSGIQRFIYHLAEPNTKSPKIAKRLRGRSFYLSLLSESVAHAILNLLDLYEVHLVINGGGHFNIIAPNTSESIDRLKEFEIRINKWLNRMTEGVLSFLIVWDTFSENQMKDFGKIKEQMSYLLNQKKSKKGFINLKSIFYPEDNVESSDVCSVCGVDVSEKGMNCPICRQTVALGKEMMYADCLINISNISCDPKNLPESAVFFEELSECWIPVRFNKLKTFQELIPEIMTGDSHLHFSMLNSTKFDWKTIRDLFVSINRNMSMGFILIGNYAPHKKGTDAIYEFSDLARLQENGKTIPEEEKYYPMLSVARLDVDSLGAIFSTGLGENKFLSHQSSLSRELNFFFTAFVNYLAGKNHIYITYSGGDDLFVIGRWDFIIEFVFELNDLLKKYACHNPDITISGGLYNMRPGFPVRNAAKYAGDEESKSKNYKDSENKQSKNAVSIFGEVFHWKEMNELIDYGKKLVTLMDNSEIPRSFIHLLIDIRAKRQRNIIEGKDDLKWISEVKHLIHYALARRKVTAKEIEKIGEDDSDYFRVETLSRLLNPEFLNRISIPASYALYKTRSI